LCNGSVWLRTGTTEHSSCEHAMNFQVQYKGGEFLDKPSTISFRRFWVRNCISNLTLAFNILLLGSYTSTNVCMFQTFLKATMHCSFWSHLNICSILDSSSTYPSVDRSKYHTTRPGESMVGGKTPQYNAW